MATRPLVRDIVLGTGCSLLATAIWTLVANSLENRLGPLTSAWARAVAAHGVLGTLVGTFLGSSIIWDFASNGVRAMSVSTGNSVLECTP